MPNKAELLALAGRAGQALRDENVKNKRRAAMPRWIDAALDGEQLAKASMEAFKKALAKNAN